MNIQFKTEDTENLVDAVVDSLTSPTSTITLYHVEPHPSRSNFSVKVEANNNKAYVQWLNRYDAYRLKSKLKKQGLTALIYQRAT